MASGWLTNTIMKFNNSSIILTLSVDYSVQLSPMLHKG